MARTYKRDSRGRFAGGGGGSGPRGGKVGTRTEQRRNAKAQAERSAQFRGKAAPNAAKTAYKSATSRLRFERTARAEGGGSASQVKKAQSAVTRMAASRVSAKPKSKTAAPVAAKPKATSSAQAARNKQFSSKAAPNKAKDAYRDARSAMREARMYAGGRTSTAGIAKGRTDAGAKRIRANVAAVKAAQKKVSKMEATRGAYKPRRRRS